nr:glutamate receptor 3-like [Cherax quadricarinatus]
MALKGRNLRVAGDVWVPWVLLKQEQGGTLQASGILIDFLDILAEKLNFTLDSERVLLLQEADMALGPFSITYVRSRVIDYSVPLYVDNFGIFLPRPRLERDLAGFTKPFAWEVWMVLLAMLVTSCLLVMLMKVAEDRWHLAPAVVDTKVTQAPSWDLSPILQADPLNLKPRTLRGRLLLGVWLLGALILGAAYEGVLTSLLASPRVPVPVNSLEDLIKYAHLPWSVEAGTALHQLLGDAKAGVYKKVTEGAFLISSLFEEKDNMKKKRFAILCDFFSMKQVMSDDYSLTGECNYYIAQEIITSTSMAFVFPKGSALVSQINKWLMMMRESGLVNRNLDELTSNATTCLVPPGKEFGVKTLVLSLDDFAGVFLLLATGDCDALHFNKTQPAVH